MAKQTQKPTSAEATADVKIIKGLEDTVKDLTEKLAQETAKRETLEAELVKEVELKTVAEALLEDTKTELEKLQEAFDLALESPATTKNLEVVKEEVVEEKRPVYTLKDKRKFKFKKTAPKHLKVLDVVYSQEELMKNKEAMEFLIYGNSFFVEQEN